MTTLAEAPAFYRDAIVWDAHSCMPLKPGQDLSALERHHAAGVTYVSINVGMDFNPIGQIVQVLAGYRDWLARHPDRFLLAETVADIARAKREGKLAVAFDLEGSVMLQDDLAMLRLYRDLGVRQIHLAYNRNNSIAGGCRGGDRGLTALGREVVGEINALGLLMDCSHVSRQTSLEIMEISTKPVVFSHANVRALKDHPRNIDDAQIRACAATDGVIGLSGIGVFLGENDISTQTLLRHVAYLAERVGPRHIGLGLDYVFEPGDNDLPASEDPEDWWPSAYGYNFPSLKIVPPEQLPEIAGALTDFGFSAEEASGILGGNFLRAAQATWQSAKA